MTPTEALDVLHALGITVTVAGADLVYRPAPPTLLRPGLATLKPQLVALIDRRVKAVVQAAGSAFGPVEPVAVTSRESGDRAWREAINSHRWINPIAQGGSPC